MKKRTLDSLYSRMPWDEIDTVVFDVGNVLISPGFDGIFDKYPVENAEEIIDMTYRSPYWVMLDRGTMDLDEAIDAMVGLKEQLRPHIDFVMRHWMEYKHQMEEGTFAVNQCRKHCKRLIVLSNYADCYFRYLEEHYRLFDLFDEIIVSARIGMVKPSPEIFEYAEKKCGLDGERTLFIDDAAMNCEAAMNHGWNAICANIPGKLKEFFK